jgi:hypothetical protein
MSDHDEEQDDSQYTVGRFGEYGVGLWAELAIVAGALAAVVVVLAWLGWVTGEW